MLRHWKHVHNLRDFCIAVDVFYLTLYEVFEPFKRGFFCDDESLLHPYHSSTVGNSSSFYVSLGLPIVIIIVIEVERWKLSVDDIDNLRLFNRDVPYWVANGFKYIEAFLFGFLVNVLTTNITKFAVGRLRPHFISVCHPVMLDGRNCTDMRNHHRYIEDYTCGNAGASDDQLFQMRLSFPSGHSSISMFSMMFAVIYLQRRMEWEVTKLLKHFLQFALFLTALHTALSRISDYKHHCKQI